MICHIVFESEYSHGFHQFIQEHFDHARHFFLVWGRASWDESKKYEYTNSLNAIDSASPNILELLERASQIIIHGLFIGEVVEFFYRHPHLLAKADWVIWGGDLYCYRQAGSPGNPHNKEQMRQLVIQNFRGIIGQAGDHRMAQQVYNTRAVHRYAFYPQPLDHITLNNATKSTHTHFGTTILLGNSATPENCHKEAFSLLQPYTSEDIKIFCPLSYGLEDYGQDIISMGNHLFAENFLPLTRFLPFSKYAELLNTIDVAVMNHNRQQGVGNILALLYLGKKVYLRSDTTTFHFLKSFGIKIFDMSELASSSFSDFIHFDKTDALSNSEIVHREFSLAKCQELWSEVFDENHRGMSMPDADNLSQTIPSLKTKYFPNSSFVGPYERHGYSFATIEEQWLWDKRRFLQGIVLDMSTPRYWHEYLYNLPTVSKVLISEYDQPFAEKYGQKSPADVVGDFCATPAPMPPSSVDTILCLSILEHCVDPLALLQNLALIVKPGGHIFVSAPFAYQDGHHHPDYWRFTKSGFRLLAEKAGLKPIEDGAYCDMGHYFIHDFGIDLSATPGNNGVPFANWIICQRPSVRTLATGDNEGIQTVSVVIPTFNRESTITRAIRSAQNQSLHVHEIVVADDGSTDQTEEIVRSLARQDARIRFIPMRPGDAKGAQPARNRGIRAATGRWITFLDSDDEYLHQKIELQMQSALREKVPVIHCECFIQEASGRRRIFETNPLQGQIYDKLLAGPPRGPTFPGLFVHCDALSSIGLLDENVPSWQEWETSIRLSRQFRFAFVAEPLFIYHLHDGETISKNLERDARGYAYIFEKHRAEIVRVAGPAALASHYEYLADKYSQVSRQNARLASNNPDVSHAKILKMAVVALNSADFDSALELLDQVVGMVGEVPDLNFARAQCLYRLGRHSEALKAAQAELRLQPNNSKCHTLISDLNNRCV